jgi:SulP family sulfate permease
MSSDVAEAGEPTGGRTATVVAATIALSLVSLAYNLAFAAIVYRDELAFALPLGLGVTLVAQVISGVFVAVRSSIRGHFAGPQDTPAIVLAPAAASLAGLGASTVPTVFALAALSTLAVGLALWLIGRLGLGGLLRYLPFPVVAGFLAGLGLVLIRSGFQAGVADDSWASGAAMARWVPALVLGAVLLLAGRIWPDRSLLVPVLAVASLPLAHIVLRLGGLDVAEAQSRGLLLGPYASGLLWRPSEIYRFADIDWGALARQLTTVAPILVLYPVTVLMNLAAIDHQTGVDGDTDDDLRLNGLSNLLIFPFGSTASGTQLGETTLSWRLAGPSRTAAIMTALLNGVVVIVGGSLLSLIPSVLVDGMVFFLGLGFVADWLWDVRRRLPRSEYGLVVAVAVVIAAFDFSIGVVFGILVAVLLFAVRYSRIGAIRHLLTTAERRSNVQWGEHADLILDDRGRRSLILELDGFLFFGSVARVLEPIEARLAEDPPLEVLVVDFRRVVGIDSDAALSFEKLADLAERQDVAVVLSSLADTDRRRLVVDGDEDSWLDRARLEPDLDRAMQWAEVQLLGHDARRPPVTFEDWLAAQLDAPELAADLAPYWELRTLRAGETLLRQGGDSLGLAVIEDGTVSIYRSLEPASGGRRRVRTLHPGTLFGEIGIYREGTATATAEADTDLALHVLAPETLAELEAERPELAVAVHRIIGEVLVERVTHADQLIEVTFGR